MFLVTNDKVVELSGSIDEMRAVLVKDEYNYACFLYSDRLSVLFDQVKPEKVRLMGDWEGQNLFFPDVPTAFLYPSEDNYKFASGSPLVHFSCLGWSADSPLWTENRMSEDKYSERLLKLSKFAPKKRLFFYGTKPQEETGGIRRTRRIEQMSILSDSGFTVVSSTFVPSENNKLIDAMEETECFAAVGFDGLSIGCKRDHEFFLSAVPFIRVTHKKEYLRFVDPLHMGWAVSTNGIRDVPEIWNNIKTSVSDGTLTRKLFNARDMSTYFFNNARFMQVLDSVAFNHGITNEIFEALVLDDMSQAEAVKYVLENASKVAATPTNGYSFCDSQGDVLPNKFSILIPEKFKEKIPPLSQSLIVSSKGKETPTNPKLSFIIPCMGRLDHLKQSLPHLSIQVDSEVVVVDWSCPEKSGEWAARWPITRVVDVVGEKKFNLSKSRNIGAKAARGEWLCFLDCDMVMVPDFSKIVIDVIVNKIETVDEKKRKANYFISFGTIGEAGHAGMTICRKADWEAVGGYDEQMEGWGWEDTDFKKRLRIMEILEYTIDKGLARHIDHGNEERTKYYDNKDQDVSHAKNQKISDKKLDNLKHMSGFWSATHASWTGALLFNSNGTFERYKHYDKGNWIIEGKHLILKWLQWPPEKLEERSLGYFVGNTLAIKKVNNGIEMWASYFELGGGLGDKLCALSAVREYAKKTTQKVKVSNPELADVISASGGASVSFGLGGKRIFCDNGPKHFGRNYLEAFRSSLGLPLGPLPHMELPALQPHPDFAPGSYVVVQPVGNSWVNLSDESLQVLVDRCAQFGKVVVTGKPGTPKRLRGVEYVFDHDVIVMLKLIRHARAVLTPHSASAHIASGYNVPTLIWADLDVKHEMHFEYPGWNKVRVSPLSTTQELLSALDDLLCGRRCEPIGLTTKTSGHLGNEMFQYAVTRLLAEEDGLAFKVPCQHVNKAFPNLEMERGTANTYLHISGDPYYHSYGTCVDLVLSNYEKLLKWFPVSDYGRTFLDSIGNPPIVHVRGTDFQNTDWTLGQFYYSEAIKKLSSKPVVITDDPAYAKTLFPDLTIMSTEDEFSVLAHATELVCSYSSFCWWAAFLGKHKLVVVPEKDELFTRSSTVLSWMKVPCVPGETPNLVPSMTSDDVDIAGEWKVSHAQWADVIRLDKDGSFVRENAAWDTGVWEVSEGKVTLKWKRWDPEEAIIKDGNLVGKRFIATRKWKLKNPKISFCTTCKGRLWQLEQTYIKNIEMATAEYPNVEFILLDYRSPDGLEEWAKKNLKKYVEKGVLKYFKLYDDIPWHAAKSRNMAHRVASGDILCNLDADNFLEEGYAVRLSRYIGPKMASRIGGDKSLGGRIAIYKGDFYGVGGYDESLAPMGHLDNDIEKRLTMAGVAVAIWPATVLPIPNTDEQRAEFCGGMSYEACCNISKKKMNENLLLKRVKVNE